MVRAFPEQISLNKSNFKFKNQLSVYHGKVRDVYDIGDRLIMIASDRISAFDHILPRAIPYKGQVLNQTAAYFLEQVKDICPVWWESSPDPNVSIGIKCDPIPIEVVVRGYLAGHAWREYKSGKRILCGEVLGEGMKESDKLMAPIITPTTKASAGHDEDTTRAEILNSNIISESDLDLIYNYAFQLFERGAQMAEKKGLILVDTKYEFGWNNDEIVLMDEIHTPDSSRYYISEGYEDRQAKGEHQIQLSKEFVREWLIAHGFQGLEDQLMPEMPDAFVWEISNRYIELYEKVTGIEFKIQDNLNIEARIKENMGNYF